MATAAAAVPDASPRHARAIWLDLAAMALIAVVFIPCVVGVVTDPYWAADPRSQLGSVPVVDLGPGGGLILNALTLAITGLTLILHRPSAGRASLLGCVTAMLGMAVVATHLSGHHENVLIAAHALAAVAGGLAAFVLAQYSRPRRILLAGLLALAVPLALSAVWYAFYEHAGVLQRFRANPVDALQAQGIEPGSPQALIFERRLQFPDAVGVFGLSNVFGSVLAALCLAGLGMVGARLAGRRMSPTTLAAAACATGLAALGLYLTHSRGAVLAAILATGLLGWCVLGVRWPLLRRVVTPVAVLLLLLPLSLVLLRGALGPPDTAQGERSLLFRYQYWSAAGRIMAEQSAMGWFRGVTPVGLRETYLRLKNPLNPEEIRSLHSVFLDYLVMFGAAGALWSGLLIAWLIVAARGAIRCLAGTEDSSANTPSATTLRPPLAAGFQSRDLLTVLAPAAAVFGVQFWIHQPKLLPESAGMAAIGMIAYLIVGVIVLREDSAAVAERWALLAAAAVLLIHNQIEMTFLTTGATGLGWLIVGAAAGTASGPDCRKPAASEQIKGDTPLPATTGNRGTGAAMWIAGALLVAAGLWLGWGVARPVLVQQHHLAQAAADLRQRRNPLPALDAAIAAVPRDPDGYRQVVRLWMEAAMAANSKPDGRAQVAHALEKAAQALARARAAGLRDVAMDRAEAQRLTLGWRLLGNPAWAAQAVAAWKALEQRAPMNMSDWLQRAQLYEEMHRTDDAVAAYRRVLELNRENYLDPLRQLQPSQEQQIRDRLAALTGKA